MRQDRSESVNVVLEVGSRDRPRDLWVSVSFWRASTVADLRAEIAEMLRAPVSINEVFLLWGEAVVSDEATLWGSQIGNGDRFTLATRPVGDGVPQAAELRDGDVLRWVHESGSQLGYAWGLQIGQTPSYRLRPSDGHFYRTAGPYAGPDYVSIRCELADDSLDPCLFLICGASIVAQVNGADYQLGTQIFQGMTVRLTNVRSARPESGAGDEGTVGGGFSVEFGVLRTSDHEQVRRLNGMRRFRRPAQGKTESIEPMEQRVPAPKVPTPES